MVKSNDNYILLLFYFKKMLFKCNLRKFKIIKFLKNQKKTKKLAFFSNPINHKYKI